MAKPRTLDADQLLRRALAECGAPGPEIAQRLESGGASAADWALAAQTLETGKRLREAALAAERAVEREPMDGAHRRLWARILLVQNKARDAAAVLAPAWERAPDEPELTVLFLELLSAANEFARAEQVLGAALSRRMDDPRLKLAQAELLRRIAKARARLGLRDDAQKRLRVAGQVLCGIGRIQEAVEDFRAALALAPSDIGAANDLGAALYLAQRYRDVIDLLGPLARKGIEHVDVFANLGAAHWQNFEPEIAEPFLRRAIALNRNHVGALINLANLLNDDRRCDEAIALSQRAIASGANLDNAHFASAIGHLLKGDWRSGFGGYERRPGLGAAYLESSPGRWRGPSSAKAPELVVLREQGFGDAIQMLRFVQRLPEHADRVVLITPTPIARLARLSLANVDVESFERPSPACFIPLMSLPLAFDARPEPGLWSGAYVKPDPVDVASQRDRLGERRGLRVGVVWGGSPDLRDDVKRSINPNEMAHALDLDGVDLISLQVGRDPEGLKDRLRDWTSELSDFADTAALIENLDVVVAVDTAVAHLAGAMGKPVWMLNRYSSEWRWLIGQERTHWYPSMRIFNQERPGDWSIPLRKVREALEACVHGASPSLI